MNWFYSRRRVLLAALILIVATGVVLYRLRRVPAPALPGPGDPRYEAYVSAFQTGTAQLDADLMVEAEENLSRAVETIPEEPAGWANRAVLRMRGIGRSKEAAADLARAQESAPGNADLEELAGFLAERDNRLSEARDHFRNASAADPRNTRRLYKLADLIAKIADPDADRQRLALFERILEVEPANLPVLAELANLAEQAKDRPTLQATLTRMDKLSPAWHEQTQKQLASVRKEFDDPRSTALQDQLRGLGNVLMREPSYAATMENLSPQGAKIGTTFQTFVRLTPVRAAPDSPDLELTFQPIDPRMPAAVQAESWAGILPLWLDGTHPPAVFVFDARHVRRADAAGPVLEFPCGADGIPASLDGILGIDWDNDQKTDLVLAGAGGLRFHHQNGEGAFDAAPANMKLSREILAGNYYGAWAVDIDFDGDLDIVLARRKGEPLLLRNNFDGSFTPQSIFPGTTDLRAFAWADLDNDGAADAALLDGSGRLHVFMNQRSGRFTRRAVPDPHAVYVALAVMDANDDGVLDLIALTDKGALVRISDRDKGNAWETAELTASAGDLPLTPGTVRLQAIDLDSNGAVDLIVRTPSGGVAWLADGKGGFQSPSAAVPPGTADVVDRNDDGTLDFFGLDERGRIQCRAAAGSKKYQWLAVKPRSINAVGDNRINGFALGGELELRSGTLVVKQPIDRPTIRFGLGSRKSMDLLKVQWPNGSSQYEFKTPVGGVTTVVQRLKGSCPFLFTWNGERMVFVTDFCWSTPLGMYINAQNQGGFPQTTDWVKIRGDQLVPHDGVYDVRINANLWETHYLDELGLMVVDHPPETEVHVDERFFLEPTAPRVYLTAPSKPIGRAWDHHGHDVTEIVRAVDGNYLDRAGRGTYQGITNDHWVEIDLGDEAPVTGPVYLLGQGWIHPTDSSINYAIESNASIRPQPLTLEIPDGKGGWKPGKAGLGFLAGKNKTCVIRLDGIEGERVTRRFRLRTNLEIYWDAFHYAVGLDAERCRLRRLPTRSADLSFRGILRMTQASPSAPELPHYDDVVRRGQHWRDLIGFHTRFGDVNELIAAADDRYVIMNAGDELRLTYSVADAPPAGWLRDFVWICDGWVKDGDLNTHWGKTVLPLPYHGMANYHTPPGRLEDDPVFRRFPGDWNRYHTRYVAPTQYERGLRAFHRPQENPR